MFVEMALSLTSQIAPQFPETKGLASTQFPETKGLPSTRKV
jgi:hypothetical protein